MKNSCNCQVIGILSSSKTYAEEELPSVSYPDCEPADSIKATKHSRINWMKKFRNKLDNLSHGKVALSTKNVSETMKRNSKSISKRIFQKESVERFFRKSFNVNKDERLLGAYKCSLFTTAGPIKGRVFITSERITFHSKKFLELSTVKGELAKFPYKVSVPLKKIKKTTISVNLNKPDEKFLQIVTVDEFEFWFMNFGNCQRPMVSLHRAISEQQ
ncbi:hypothetical protein LUZ61_010206 [Rhynchospora tenuis]|uniref:GRAM domain-containing protein n=1 Tax=Rhynchospora tenuis TaxID=198213 RepID=A0AAD5ZYN7_9POAL|nr:hypothetical protein LUZ61_010206 [Rhynchospora tenuis]